MAVEWHHWFKVSVSIKVIYKTRFKLVVISLGHRVTKIHNLTANASNDLLFVAYEAYYNVVLRNHNLKGQVYLVFVKN